jgi:hypothetical protein
MTIRSTLALPVKGATLNLPPLIASTSGSVDQMKCVTPASKAARTAAAACLPSSASFSQKLVTRNTRCRPEPGGKCLRPIEIGSDDFVAEAGMLTWMAGQRAGREWASVPERTFDSAPLLSRGVDDGDHVVVGG